MILFFLMSKVSIKQETIMYYHTFGCRDIFSDIGYVTVIIASEDPSYETSVPVLNQHLKYLGREDYIEDMEYQDTENISTGVVYSDVEDRC